MVKDEEIRKVHDALKKGAEELGHYFNYDEDFTMELVEGLLENRDRYGYMSCPCRLASGEYERDEDIICPCAYRERDLEEYGACYCALYVTKKIRDERLQVGSIPERRKNI
ncbi:MAG TPA: ferredoxin-thioredoxin reductase catalytic domain-containing protein [Candidatus Methanofastidiosa archaeon]|nr:ferredoxin-thioredoxin reductase catalytic domain-containing protein [Candidatus Methanofastidiosa archaeon]HPR41498.1 ferredoxin-thioredoxin reductase catalytic domain-containing protein [Candidatus Methanofastidiosa archaeon]